MNTAFVQIEAALEKKQLTLEDAQEKLSCHF